MGNRLDLAPFTYLEKLEGLREILENFVIQIFYTRNIPKGKKCSKILE